VWEIPAGTEPGNRDGWKPAKAAASYSGGAALDNGRIAVVAAVGGDSILLIPADRALKASAQIVPVADGKGFGKITGAKIEKQEESEASLKVSFAGADLSIGLGQGQVFVAVKPGKGVGAIEVGGRTAYVLMPDFFGHDVVLNPKQLKSDVVSPPAENFLLNMQAGGDAIVMCVWQGPLSLGKEKKGDEKEPRVDLLLTGKGADRLVEKTRHECDGKPLYVALLAKKALWFEKDIAADPANKPMTLEWAQPNVSLISTNWLQENKPMALDWARPYEAKWRAIFVGKPGKVCGEFMVKDVTWDITYDSEHLGRRDDAGNPGMWWQGEWKFFTLPAWIQDKSSNKVFISIYADRDTRMNWPNKARLAQAKKENTPCVPQYPKSDFERLIVYAIDRRKETPLNEKTPTDVMRDCLGIGPCEYVLDREGLKEKTTRNGRYVHPTCHTYEAYISQFAAAAGGRNANLSGETRNGKQGIPLAGLKAGEKFQPEDEAILVDRLEDLGWFADAINNRLHQYNTFAKSMIEFCGSAVSNNPALKPVANATMASAKSLLGQCSDKTLSGMTAQRDTWTAKVTNVVADVKAGKYGSLGSTGAIRDYAVNQDTLVGVCHRLVKGMRQAAAVVDSSNPEVTAFANKVRSMCHDMLRNKGHFE
jgi:hypothetical protein